MHLKRTTKTWFTSKRCPNRAVQTSWLGKRTSCEDSLSSNDSLTWSKSISTWFKSNRKIDRFKRHSSATSSFGSTRGIRTWSQSRSSIEPRHLPTTTTICPPWALKDIWELHRSDLVKDRSNCLGHLPHTLCLNGQTRRLPCKKVRKMGHKTVTLSELDIARLAVALQEVIKKEEEHSSNNSTWDRGGLPHLLEELCHLWNPEVICLKLEGVIWTHDSSRVKRRRRFPQTSKSFMVQIVSWNRSRRLLEGRLKLCEEKLIAQTQTTTTL